jgi:hypothetical protein
MEPRRIVKRHKDIKKTGQPDWLSDFLPLLFDSCSQSRVNREIICAVFMEKTLSVLLTECEFSGLRDFGWPSVELGWLLQTIWK